MIKGKPSDEVMQGIITRLGSDPAFREKMLGDPKAAFAEHGVEVDESKIPLARSLPSMEEFRRNREAYFGKLTGELGYSWFYLR